MPNGIVFAVDDVTFIEAPLTLPVFAAATENVNVGSTDADTAMDVVVSMAKATDAVSITVEPVSEYVVTRAKNVVSVVVGFVIPVYDTVTACVSWDAGVVITVDSVPFPVKSSVLPVPATLSLARVAPVVTIPVGVEQAPDAVVQNTTLSCFTAVVTVVVNAKSYVVAALPARESEIVTFAGVNVPACTSEVNGTMPSEHIASMSINAIYRYESRFIKKPAL